ncbi:MAG TPA: DUF308 domain-containing protein [Galbitalea sp.]|jgi:uncharacterized membrane protein HdeD (DUF308 family)|nr:DUF308 domain-containing protein [Galbitalea sp.]
MTTPPAASPASPTTVNVLAVRRGLILTVAIIGVLLGLFGLFLPTAALLFVSIVFGIYLVFSGIFRINAALLTHNLTVGFRWITGILGILIVAAGVLCLADPWRTLIVLAYLIGIGWIAAGISDVMAAVQGRVRRRWLHAISGILAILAGIVIFVLPAVGLESFVFLGSILLLVVSVVTLTTLPGKPKVPAP